MKIMLNRKIATGILFSSIFIISGCSQKLHFNMEKIKPEERSEIISYNIDLAKNILINDCRKDKNREKYWDGTLSEPRKQYGIYEVDSMEIIPISLFEINKEATKYSSNIIQFIEWKKDEIIGFYTLQQGKFEGLLDWSDIQHRDLSKECNYFTIDNDNMIEYFPLSKGFKFLLENERDTGFLFGVKYFLSTLWFIEDEKVYVLDLKNMKVYDPDEFIKLKCDENFVRDIAKGGKITCNY